MSRTAGLTLLSVLLLLASFATRARAQCFVCGTTGCSSFSWGRTTCAEWVQGGILHCGTGGYNCSIVETGPCDAGPEGDPALGARPANETRPLLIKAPCRLAAHADQLLSVFVFRLRGGLVSGAFAPRSPRSPENEAGFVTTREARGLEAVAALTAIAICPFLCASSRTDAGASPSRRPRMVTPCG